MTDGEIDYDGYSNAELHEALQAIDREKYPRNYENLQAALLERRQRDPVGIRRIMESDPRLDVAAFTVRFATTPLAGVPDNSFGVSGRGTLEFSADRVYLVGKGSSGVWRQKRAATFLLADIVSVERSERAFRLRIAPAGAAPLHLAFIASEADCEAIGRRLPPPADRAAQPDTEEVADFERRLATISQRTPVTYALIGVNVAVFLAMAWQGAGVLAADGNLHVAWGSNLVPITVDGEWWRLATSMFLHFGIVHLFVNMWVLYSNGRLTERLFGSARFAILYLGAGLAGSMASAGWHAAANSAGASGAVFGMLGGLLAFMLVKRHRMPATVIQAHRGSVMAFVVYNIVFGLSHPGIDNAAHVGGFVAGVLIGLALARPIDAEARSEPQALRVAGITIAAALLLVAAADLVLYTKERLPSDQGFAANRLWFVHRESKVLAAYNGMVEQAQDGSLPDAELAERIGAEVIPFYARAAERLRFDPSISGEAGNTEQAFARYASLRHESLLLMERALREGDANGVAKAMEISRAADEAVTKINEAMEQGQATSLP